MQQSNLSGLIFKTRLTSSGVRCPKGVPIFAREANVLGFMYYLIAIKPSSCFSETCTITNTTLLEGYLRKTL